MITHIVTFRWKGDAPTDQSTRVSAGLATLPALVPSLRTYHFGADVGARDGNFDYAVVATFDDLDGWREYDQSADHNRVADEMIRPFIESRASVQFES